ncbi:MAG: DUF6600 domain-containing protein [Candidatus Acidiferrales bacterium]
METTRHFRIQLFIFAAMLPLFFAAALFAQDPPGRAGRLSYVGGNVSLQPAGETQWSAALLNYTITTGDRLYTDQGARADLEIGGSAVRMSDATDVTVTNLTDNFLQVGLAQGTIRVTVYEMQQDHSIELDTPNGALNIQEAGSYRVDTSPNDGVTLVSVSSGSLQVSGGDASQDVGSGQAVTLTGTDSIQIQPAYMPTEDSFDQWCAERDRRANEAAAAEGQYVSRDMPGYADLNYYGRWQQTSVYGPVWYPTDVPQGWAPYRYGHWAWVNPWGWTWVEDEPWGFSPFHYGRWAYVGSSWGWIPGPADVAPVYSPALVAFVGGGGFSVSVGFGQSGVAAWFPLGPGDVYHPWYHHDDNYLRQVNVTNIRNVNNVTNFTNITNVRNVTNVTNVNNTNVTNIRNVTYVNQRRGVTAVQASAFNSGRSVAPRMVRVTPQQIARAQVIPHPTISPTQHAVVVEPVAAPPIRIERARAAPRAVVAAAHPAGPRTVLPNRVAPNRPGQPYRAVPNRPGQPTTPVPNRVAPNRPVQPYRAVPNRPGQPTTPVPNRVAPNRPVQPYRAVPNRPGQPTTPVPNRVAPNTPGQPYRPVPNRPAQPATPASNRVAPNRFSRTPPPAARPNLPPARPMFTHKTSPPQPPLVTRTPPPQRHVPFVQQRPALQQHPGRPLEPRQIQNIRAGKPAGPVRDREFPPHPVARPAPRRRPAPPPKRPAPPPKHPAPPPHKPGF